MDGLARSLLLALAIAAACGDDGGSMNLPPDGSSGADDIETTGEADTQLQVAGCGNRPYTLLPVDEVGSLVDFDPAASMQWEAWQLDALAQLAGAHLDPLPHGVRMHRFRYTTQDHGEVVEATGALLVPDGSRQGSPTLLWLHGTSGWSDACAPGNDPVLSGYAAVFAAHGYVVVAPDFIGMSSFGGASTRRHPWLVAEPTALAAWDAMPAAAELLPIVADGARPGNRVVILGASQGGHAALFTERYGQYYAPGYDVVAQVALVPASSISTLMAYLVSEGVDPAALGIVPPMFPAYRAWYGAPADLSGVFTDTAPHHFARRADALTFGDACVDEVAFHDALAPEDVFAPSFLAAARADVSALEPWGCYAAENSIATHPNPPLHTTTPTLVTLAERDEILPGMAADVTALCDLGYDVELVTCAGEDHLGGAIQALPRVLPWIADRVAGVPMDPDKTCVLDAPTCCTPDCSGKG